MQCPTCRSGRTGRAGRDGTTINLVAREPQTVELRGRTVELSEKHFVGAIEVLGGVAGCMHGKREGEERGRGQRLPALILLLH